MKKILCIAICILILLSGFSFASAATNGYTVLADGKILTLANQPYLSSGGKSIYLPLREVCEGNGLTVGFIGASQTVVVKAGDKSIALKAGSDKVVADDKTVTLDGTITAKDGHTFVTDDFFTKCAGFEVSVDKSKRLVEITTPDGILKGVSCYKQSTVRIQRDKVIYFDPFMVSGEPKDADVVFVTHTHGDHFSVDDLRKVMKDGALLVITADGVQGAKDAGFKNILTVEPNKSYTAKGISFETVPAYNVNKDFHKKESKWVGYIVSLNGVRYYIAGDTDLIPEMKNISADVDFLPVGGTYTMTATEAAQAANVMKPEFAVPIHFGDVVGSTQDARTFVSLLKPTIKGVIMKDLLDGVQHFKQSTIRIQRDKTIYFDPFMVTGEPRDADIVFVTHTHGDHFSPADIKKVLKDGGTLVITADGVQGAKDAGFTNIVTAEPNKTYDVGGIPVETVPAYNTNKDFHQRASGWVGYIVTLNGTRYYIAGDTDVIEEMTIIKADVAFLPVGGTYTMNAVEASEAANMIKPVIAVPIHFADIVGTYQDAQTFILNLNGSIKGEILKKP